MQEHPIPQDITGYRFHIIGSMTLKQFGEVLLGVIIAVIIYSTNLILVIKIPLIILSVGMGAAMAFVPFEERPLGHWISTFFRILYKPTKFYWRREEKIPDVFIFTSSNSGIIQEPEVDLTPAKRQRIKEYLGSIHEQSSFSEDFTSDEMARMNEILASFGDSQGIIAPRVMSSKPNLDVRVRTIRKPQSVEEVTIFDAVIAETPMIMDYSADEPVVVEEKIVRKMTKTQLSTDQVAQNIVIPKIKNINLEEIIEEENKNGVNPASVDHSEKVFFQEEASLKKVVTATHDATTNADLPFPTKPTKPNKVVGMILSQTSDLLTNAIVEIQTTGGSIERAVKTNALGQFFITTPLKAGDYTVVVEKDGYTFEPLHLNVKDEVIQPLEIRSTN